MTTDDMGKRAANAVLHDAQTMPVIDITRVARRRHATTVLSASLLLILILGLSTLAATALTGGTEPDVAAPAQAAAGGFSCPPGSTPDQQGPDWPRPPQDGYMYGATTFDPGSGRALRLTMEGAFWTFDVCTNAWASEPLPEGIDGRGVQEFVYDVDSDRAIAFADAFDTRDELVVAQVWTYEPDTQAWTEKDEWAMGPIPEGWTGWDVPQQIRAVYDPVSGLVLVREQSTAAMWTYDVDTDTWTDIDQGTTLPPAAVGPEGGLDDVETHAQVLTYDASVDRLILYDNRQFLYDNHGNISGTWEFDIRAGKWERQDATLPDSIHLHWGDPRAGDKFTFDEANEVSVLFVGGTLATYDASEHFWTVLQVGTSAPDAEPPERLRWFFAMTYDSVNERILVFGGDSDEVIAYDVATGEWITLLEPTSG